MELATIHVSGVNAKVVQKAEAIPVNITGGYVDVIFDDDWAGLIRTAVIQGVVTKDIVNVPNRFKIPRETVSESGVRLKVGFYGVSQDGGRGIPTLWADLGVVQDAADPSGDESTDPSLPVWAELVKAVGDLKKLNTKDKENLVAAINEVLRNGGADPETINRIVQEYLDKVPGPDWNAPAGKPGHILNRTHYSVEAVEVLPEIKPYYDEAAQMFHHFARVNLVVDKNYIVNWNGKEYRCTAWESTYEGEYIIGLGDKGWLEDGFVPTTEEPFVIGPVPATDGDDVVFMAATDGATEVTVSIFREQEQVRKLDNKYLDLAWIPRYKVIKTHVTNRAVTVREQPDYNGTLVGVVDGVRPSDFPDGTLVRVTVDGVDHYGVAESDIDAKWLNMDTEEFFVGFFISTCLFAPGLPGTYTLSMATVEPVTIPKKFLPEGLGDVDLSGYVKSINGIKPDPETGNVEITIPESGGNVDLTIDGETLVIAEKSTATIDGETLIL